MILPINICGQLDLLCSDKICLLKSSYDFSGKLSLITSHEKHSLQYNTIQCSGALDNSRKPPTSGLASSFSDLQLPGVVNLYPSTLLPSSSLLATPVPFSPSMFMSGLEYFPKGYSNLLSNSGSDKIAVFYL